MKISDVDDQTGTISEIKSLLTKKGSQGWLDKLESVKLTTS